MCVLNNEGEVVKQAKLAEKIDDLEKRIDKLWIVEKQILEELSIIKNRSRINHKEINRLEHIVISLLEELSILKESGSVNMFRIENAVKKYLEDKNTGQAEA